MILLLSACAANPTAAPTGVGATHASPLPATGMPSPTAVATSTHTPAVVPVMPTASATATVPTRPSATATPVPTLALPARLAANRWKEWPVIPAITNRARQIYAQGLGRNDPHAFSKVGDCQGIKEVWLGVYDQPGLYKLSPENVGLQETIDWFAGSFNRNGFALMGGYNARAVLQPAVADPAFCQPGENPIECEYRRHHPSIVLVSLEFYYDGRTTANYEQNLRQVLNFFIARGVVPVLATKADNMEGDESLNLTNARLALEYDLPLWNFWRAVQPLPNHGMDITRPDGFHISVDAWRERSSSALQSLDAVWRGVRDLVTASVSPGGTAVSAPVGGTTAAPTARSTSAVQATPTPVPATQVILGLAERSANATRSKGVYRLDIKAQTLTRLLADSYQLQALSPDGRQLLVNQGRDLLLVDAAGEASTAVKLTNEFYPYGASGAAWLPDGRSIVLIAERAGQGRAVWQLTLQGGAWQRLTPAQYAPHELLPSPNPSEIFWADGGCALDAQGKPLPAECQAKNWYRSGTDGTAPFNLTQMSRLLRSPDGQALAYTYLSEKNKSVLALTTGDGGQVWTPLPEGYILDYAWSPSGRWLAAVWQERSDYSGRVTGEKLYLLNPASASPGGADALAPRRDEIVLPVDLNGLVRWSPDGRWLLLASTENNAEGYRVNLRLVPVNGGAITLIDGKISPSGANFVYVYQVFWLPGRAGSN